MTKKKLKKKKIKTKQPDHSSPNSTFFLSFVGEFVEIVIKEVNYTTEMGILPLTVSGILLDIDENYIYLSDNGNSVTRAVKRLDIAVIEIANSLSEQEAALHNITIPEKPEDGN